MRTSRVRFTALITSVTLVVAAGCSGGGAARASSAQKPDLIVAAVPGVDSAGFLVALNRGLFRAQGLNVKFVPANSSETVIAAQMAGRYDITGGNYVSYIQSRAERPRQPGHLRRRVGAAARRHRHLHDA